MLSVALSVAMVCSLCTNSSAATFESLEDNKTGSVYMGCDEVSKTEGIRIERDNMNDTDYNAVSATSIEENEENCGSVIMGYAPKVEGAEAGDYDTIAENQTRGTSKPTQFWNIAKDGIYYGEFSKVTGRIYTEKYFDFVKDTGGDSDYCYWTRVDVSSETHPDTRTFKVQNYCTKCGFVSETEEFTTPFGQGSTGYIYIKHYFTTKHDGHFMYPAVVCTNPYGAIEGTIDVNYYNSWD